MMKKIFLLSVFIISFPIMMQGSVNSEFKNYIHRMWTSDHGLPQNSVYSVVQDKDGFMWFATAEGLVKFDGIKFELFDKRNVPGIKSNVVLKVFEDSKGCLWVGLRNAGVLRKCGDVFEPIESDNGDSPLTVITIAEYDGVIYFGTHGDRLKVYRDGKAVSYEKNNFLPESLIFDMIFSKEGELFVATNDGLYTINIKGDSVSRFGINEGLPELGIRTLFFDSKERLWVGFNEKGVAVFENGEIKVYGVEDGLPSEKLFTIAEDSTGRIWVGTIGGGIAIFSDGKFTSFDKSSGLTSDIVRSIYRDRENSMWVGTLGGGVDQFRRGMFSSITVKDGLSDGVVFGIFEDKSGNIYAGTYGKGLNIISPDGSVKIYDTSNGLSGDISAGVFVDSKGRIWAGTYGAGLNIIDTDGKITQYGLEQGLDMRSVTAVFEDDDGTVYIGGFSQALAVYKDGRFETFLKEGVLKNRIIWDIAKDKDGSILLATDGSGIVKLKNNRFSSITVEDGLSDNKITNLYLDENGILFAPSYDHGLNIIRDGKTSIIRKDDGLFDDTIYAIVEDNEGVMWMSSNRGLSTVSKKEMFDFIDGRIEKVGSTVYSWKDGMPSNECNGGFQKAGLKTMDGRILFPTIKGVAVMDPSNSKEDVPLPVPVVTAVYIDGERQELKEKYEVEPEKSKVRIEYTAPSYIVPEKVAFRYKLEGFDKNWVDAGTRREAEIMNLDPGSYNFLILAANSDGEWNPSPLKIVFVQKPAFHQTVLFRLILLVIIFAAIYFPVRFKMRKMETYTEELSDMITETQEELKQVSDELSSKYASSSLGDEDLGYYREIIEKYMVEQKPYLDDELTIRKLAQQLEIQPHHLSQVINSTFSMNFYTFVNSYRVDEVICLMKDPQRKHHTILAIAYDSGFKSKSSFNTIFKKMIGKTPSEYREELDKGEV